MFDISSVDMWEKELRPLSEKVMLEVKGDEILTLTLESLINHVDSDIINDRNFAFRFEPVLKVISKENYVDRFRYEAEIKAVKELAEIMSATHKVAQHELKAQKPVVEEAQTGRPRLENGPTDVYKELYGQPKARD